MTSDFFSSSLWTHISSVCYIMIRHKWRFHGIFHTLSSWQHPFIQRSKYTCTALWEDLGKQADIILHNHLQPPPWPPSCPLPHLPLCFCLLSDSLSHWEKQSLQLADAIVLLLLLIRLISLFELGASGPSPVLGELPPSLLFLTICSMKCDLDFVKRKFCVFFCASLRQRTSSSQYLSLRRAAWRRAERAGIQHYWALLHNKVVNLSLRNDFTIWIWNNTSGFIYKEDKCCKELCPATTCNHPRSPACSRLRKIASRRPKLIIRANLLAQGASSVTSPTY